MAKAVIGALRVVLGLDSAEFETGMRQAGRTTQNFAKSTTSLTSVVKGLGFAIGGLSLMSAARQYLDLADKSAKLTAQLRLATRETGNYAQAQQDVLRISMSTRSDIGATADLYATIQRNAHEMGITQEQAARSTETITKAFRISGATASEAAGGLRQFLQGLQSGILRGEELNSVLENAPRLAKALADGLNVGVGQLREMGSEGELTGTKVMAALESAAAAIDAEFQEMPVTFNEAMTVMQNAAVVTFGAFDQGGGFSEMLANFFLQGSDGFKDMAEGARELGLQIRVEFEALYNVFEPFLSGAMSAFDQINAEAAKTGGNLRELLRLIDAGSDWLSRQGALGSVLTGGTFMDGFMERNKRGGTNLLTSYDKNRKQAEESRRGRLAEQDFRDMYRGMHRDQFGNLIALKDRKPASTGGKGGGGKGGGGKKKGKSEEQLRKEMEREAERAAKALQRFTDELEGRNADIQSALADLSRSIEERSAAEINQINVRKAAEDRAIQARDELTEAQRKQLLLANEQEAALKVQMAKQKLADEQREREVQILQDRNDLAIELFGHTSSMARTAKEAREVELRILDLSFESEKARLEQIKATNASTSAEYKYAEARLAALPQLQQNAKQAVIRDTQGPLEAYLDKLPRSADEVREALERVQVDGIQGIVDGLSEAALGAKSLASVFKNVASQIVQDLIRIQMQKALTSGISNVLSGLFGGSSISTPGFSNLAGPIGGSSALHAIPAFATGGSFKVGGSSAVGDKNLFSFRANKGEMVDIRKGNDRGGSIAQIIPSPMFDVVVDGRIMGASAGIIEAGANTGVARMSQKNSRRLG